MLVRSCLLITLIKCLKGFKSLGSLCNVKSKSQWVTQWQGHLLSCCGQLKRCLTLLLASNAITRHSPLAIAYPPILFWDCHNLYLSKWSSRISVWEAYSCSLLYFYTFTTTPTTSTFMWCNNTSFSRHSALVPDFKDTFCELCIICKRSLKKVFQGVGHPFLVGPSQTWKCGS